MIKKCFFQYTMALVCIITTFSAPITWALTEGIVIRGGECSEDAFSRGAELNSNGNLIGLSANCTTNTTDKAQYTKYLDGIANKKHCVAKWSQLELNGVKVEKDPVAGNRYHCRLSGKAKDIVKALGKYPM
ncbi:MAG: hypothetical protein B0W54_23335 [Cellvibrio sp. 79]|nr:MAG: hypothetical protein B0W54_23335 [Cellvibrio sp. 79]